MRKKAFFITIEGLEGSGKSSVINFLKKYLKKDRFSVKTFREPGSTRIGRKIRRILLDNNNRELSPHTELLLYLAARTQLIEEKLKKALFSYNFIICDRFFDSTLVYQGVGLGLGKIVEEAVRTFSLGIKPDLTLILDIPAEDGLKRIKNKDRMEKKPLEFHRRLRKGYLNLAKKYPSRIKIINARGSLENIYARIKEVLKENLKEVLRNNYRQNMS